MMGIRRKPRPLDLTENRLTSGAMAALIFLLLNLGASFFKPKIRLEAENAALRQQLIVLQRKVRGRVEFTNGDRLFFIQLYRWFPSILTAITTFRPETLVRWRRAGFRRYWRWKSRNRGRPQIAVDLRALIRRMMLAIDVPPKALVWEDDQGKVWLSYNSAEYLYKTIYSRHGLPSTGPIEAFGKGRG